MKWTLRLNSLLQRQRLLNFVNSQYDVVPWWNTVEPLITLNLYSCSLFRVDTNIFGCISILSTAYNIQDIFKLMWHMISLSNDGTAKNVLDG